MQILNFGSLNVDHVYSVEHFVRPGETLDSRDYRVFSGGKGFNQSIALARAGASVKHAGLVGADGRWLIDELASAGVDANLVRVSDAPTGHAIIQVSAEGENSILIHGGANRCIEEAHIDAALADCEPGSYLLLQNEISGMERILERALQRELHVVLNPSPITSALLALPLGRVGTFVLNGLEAEHLVGPGRAPELLDRLAERFPTAEIVLTLGALGAAHSGPQGRVVVASEQVVPIDTTGAGDTFAGYFLAERLAGAEVEAGLRFACRAAELCIQRRGAAESIPRREEVQG